MSNKLTHFIAPLVIISLINISHSEQVCNWTTNYGMSIGLCKCPPSGVLIEGSCYSCKVPHCLLCSISSISQCDICETGYVLDQLTKSICVPKTNQTITCTQPTCTCSPYQIQKNGGCITCSVPNCLLCQVSSPDKCDVCHSGFVLDQLTHSQCVPFVNESISCKMQSCACSPYQVVVNNSCVNCAVSNCRLCSVGNQNECDVCKTGYVLDHLTNTICVKASQISCTQKSCACQPYQVNINGSCKNCQVKNCTLCAVGNNMECDICSTGYVLDQLTKSTCVPITNSSLSCTSITCQCEPNQSKVNGVCKSCQVPSCSLCSIDNPKECDVCKNGYILDVLTRSQCFAKLNQDIMCNSDQSNCKCSPYQLQINNKCVDCKVSNCMLCQVSNPQKCDICNKPYTYNEQTSKCDPPACEKNQIWIEDHCQCDRNKAYIDSEGKCEGVDFAKQLGMALGIGIPLVFISIAMIVLTKLTGVTQPPISGVSPDSAKNFVDQSNPGPLANASNVKVMKQQMEQH